MKGIIHCSLLIMLVVSCNSSNSLTSDLTHTWKMIQVISAGNDETVKHNPNNDRYIRFEPNGTFESGGTPIGINTGKYVLNINEGTLFLDSDAGVDDDSKWNIHIRSTEMIWTGVGSEWHENFKLIFDRIME